MRDIATIMPTETDGLRIRAIPVVIDKIIVRNAPNINDLFTKLSFILISNTKK